jgi:lipoprotein-anchoring transpeptidase ErfK/SrfK
MSAFRPSSATRRRWTRRATLGGLVSLCLPRWSSAATAKGFDPRDVEASLRLQIFLDRQGFGPGKIDGKPGEFTRKAVDCYNTTLGLAPGDYSAVLKESENMPIWTEHRVTEMDFTWVDGTLPLDPPEQAKRKLLPYRSHVEFLAERYHTDETWLRKSNPKLDFAKLKAGDTVRVPNVVPFAIESLPRPHQWAAAPAFAKRTALVDTNYKFACIFEEHRMIAAFPVTPGEEKFIHRGEWKIVVMQAWPLFRWDKSMLEAGQRSEEFHMLPPGPNSPVGVLWAGLNRSGIGLHGTATPETIGRSRSAGCIRLANWDAIRLPNFLRPGNPVVVR